MNRVLIASLLLGAAMNTSTLATTAFHEMKEPEKSFIDLDETRRTPEPSFVDPIHSITPDPFAEPKVDKPALRIDNPSTPTTSQEKNKGSCAEDPGHCQ